MQIHHPDFEMAQPTITFIKMLEFVQSLADVSYFKSTICGYIIKIFISGSKNRAIRNLFYEPRF